MRIQYQGISCFGIDYAEMLFAIKYHSDCAQGLQKPIGAPAAEAAQGSSDEAGVAEQPLQFSPLTGYACLNRCLDEHPTPYGPYEDECEICSACGGTLLSKGSAPLETACLQQPQFVSREDLGQVLPRLASLLSEIQNDLSRPWIRLRRFTTPSKETEEALERAGCGGRASCRACESSGDFGQAGRATEHGREVGGTRRGGSAGSAQSKRTVCAVLDHVQEQLNNKKKKHLEAAPKRSGHKLCETTCRRRCGSSWIAARRLSSAMSENCRCRALAKKALIKAQVALQQAKQRAEEDCRAREERQAALAEELQEMLDDLPAEPAGADAAAIDAIDAGFNELKKKTSAET